MTQHLPTDACSRSPEPLLPIERAETRTALASSLLLGELEASLQASQRALLSRDVARLEERTGEQIRLRRSLEIVWSRAAAPGSDAAPAVAGELGTAQRRVLHLGRVQVALLARAERWLSMVSHLLAGPTANYAPPRGNPPPQYRAWPSAGIAIAGTKKDNKDNDKKGDSCRA
jgi:hypothetical protein